MKNRESEAFIHGKNEQLHIKSHELMGAPEGRELGYPEEQIYQDYDDMYGADAFMGDQYPMTDTGRIQAELPDKPSRVKNAEIGEDLIQEAVQQATPSITSIEEEQEAGNKT